MKNAVFIINIDDLSVEKLIGGDYRELLPEFYELKKVVENNPWHDHQTVFDHVVKVYLELEKLLEKSDLDPRRKRLLKIATLLHDIAKPDTLITDKAGMARCPGHEILGASRVKNFAQRFGLSDNETEIVEKTVLYHGFISDIITIILANGEADKYRKIFKEVVGEVRGELLLLMQADLIGSDLQKTTPKEFELRIEIIKRLS